MINVGHQVGELEIGTVSDEDPRPARRYHCDTCDAVWLLVDEEVTLEEGNGLCELPTVYHRWDREMMILATFPDAPPMGGC